MTRIANPLVPAEVRERARRITDPERRTARSRAAAAAVVAPALVVLVLGALAGQVVAALVLSVLWFGAGLAARALVERRDHRFLAEHPDLTLEVHEYVAVAYRQLVAAADAVAAADVPVSVLADLDAARSTADELLVACHSTRPGDPVEAARIQGASHELCRLADEARRLESAVQERVGVVEGHDLAGVIEEARTRSLTAAVETVTAETEWLAGHLEDVGRSELDRPGDEPPPAGSGTR